MITVSPAPGKYEIEKNNNDLITKKKSAENPAKLFFVPSLKPIVMLNSNY